MDIDIKKLKRHRYDRTVIRGIYYLFNKWELVYIGQSDNILRRINQHTNKEFDEFAFIKIEDGVDLLKIEAEEINKYLPKYNKWLGWYSHKNKIMYMFNLIRRLWYKLPPANYRIYNMTDEELINYLDNEIELEREHIEYFVKCSTKEINRMRKEVWPMM